MDKQIAKKSWYKKLKYWIGIAGGMAFLLIIVKALSDTSSKLNVEIEKISIETVHKGIFQDNMGTIVTVHPIRIIYLDAMEGGRIEELALEEGTMVKKDDVILRLSNPDLNLSIMNSEAELAEKANILRNTQVEMEQNKLDLKQQIIDISYKIIKQKRAYTQNIGFFKQGLISEEDYLISKEDYEYSMALRKLYLERQQQDSVYRVVQIEQLEGSLENMYENLNLIRNRLENLDVKAPYNGQLGELNAEIGEQIPKGQRLGFINDLSSYKVKTEIDEHYISRVKKGLTADFEFNDQQFKLIVKKVYPQVTEGRFEVDLIFNGEMPGNIRTGQTFRAKLQLGESREALLIPKGGFYQNTGGQWVYVIEGNTGYAVKRNIRIGRQNNEYYEVLEGLNPDEKVVTSSYDNFGDVDKLILK